MKTVLSVLCLAFASFARSVLSQDILVKLEIPLADELPPSDLAMIAVVKDYLARRNRNLRSQRRLDPAWCRKACMSVLPPYCQIFYPACYDHRRRAEEAEAHTSQPKLRELTGGTCEAQKQQILNELTQVVSTESIPVVVNQSPMTCFEIIDYCDVISFNVWNADTNMMIQENIANGALICKNNYQINIEAAADDCVSKVAFALKGPGGFSHTRTEHTAGYFMYGNSGAEVFGGTLNVGTYNLTVIPDDDLTLAESISFTVGVC
jgi:hypothetical protein